MRSYLAKNVDDYIAGSNKEARPTLKEIRKIIKSTISGVEEGISWGVPFYRYAGLLAGFAVFKSHASFGLCAILLKEDREALEKKGYKTGSKTIQIGFDQKVPVAAIKKILKARAKANKEKQSL